MNVFLDVAQPESFDRIFSGALNVRTPQERIFWQSRLMSRPCNNMSQMSTVSALFDFACQAAQMDLRTSVERLKTLRVELKLTTQTYKAVKMHLCLAATRKIDFPAEGRIKILRKLVLNILNKDHFEEQYKIFPDDKVEPCACKTGQGEPGYAARIINGCSRYKLFAGHELGGVRLASHQVKFEVQTLFVDMLFKGRLDVKSYLRGRVEFQALLAYPAAWRAVHPKQPLQTSLNLMPGLLSNFVAALSAFPLEWSLDTYPGIVNEMKGLVAQYFKNFDEHWRPIFANGQYDALENVFQTEPFQNSDFPISDFMRELFFMHQLGVNLNVLASTKINETIPFYKEFFHYACSELRYKRDEVFESKGDGTTLLPVAELYFRRLTNALKNNMLHYYSHCMLTSSQPLIEHMARTGFLPRWKDVKHFVPKPSSQISPPSIEIFFDAIWRTLPTHKEALAGFIEAYLVRNDDLAAYWPPEEKLALEAEDFLRGVKEDMDLRLEYAVAAEHKDHREIDRLEDGLYRLCALLRSKAPGQQLAIPMDS